MKIGENPRHRPQCLGQRCVGVHKTISKFLGWAVSVFVDCEDDIQAALDVIEWRFENDHLTGWHFYEKQPHYAPLLREPRFQALNRQRLAIMAEQRAAITALDFGESGP